MSRANSSLLVLANRLKMQVHRFWGEKISLELVLTNRVELDKILERARQDPNLQEIAREIDKELGIYKDALPINSEPSHTPSVMANQQGRLPLEKKPVEASEKDEPTEEEKKKKEEEDKKKKEEEDKKKKEEEEKKKGGKKDPRAYLGGLR